MPRHRKEADAAKAAPMTAQLPLWRACQRWRDRRDSYRPAGEPLEPARYEVAPIPDDTTARAFVTQHHYSGTYPAARRRFGLYRGSALVGVAVYSQPWAHVARGAFPAGVRPGEVAELSRFVLLDRVPANGETWFLARTFAALRAEDFAGVLSFCDPAPRRTADGAPVFPGHIGVIYQAHNAVYLGRGRARTIRLLPDGAVLSDRILTKIRRGECGWRYGVERLVAAGAPPPADDRDLRGWLRRALECVTRTMRHPGNHRYVWGLDRAMRRLLPGGAAYPKPGGQEHRYGQ